MRYINIYNKMEKFLTQNVIDHIEKCQQRFPWHQPDIYYVQRYLHDKIAATPFQQSDRPPEKEMRDIGLCESSASEFCTYLQRVDSGIFYHHLTVKYWLNSYIENYLDYRDNRENVDNFLK